MPTYRVEGIIIKGIDFQEADRILTVFTKDRGKISVLAKGVRKITSRKAGHLDLLNHSLLFLAEGQNLSVLTEAETIDSFSGIKGDLEKAGLGYYVAEFVNEFVKDEQINYPLFRLVLMALGHLNDVDSQIGSVLVHAFELKALNELGFAPEMWHCVHCGGSLTWGGHNGFSPALGGVICDQCLRQIRRGAFSTQKEILSLLRDLVGNSLSKISRMHIAAPELVSAEQLVQAYVEYLLEKRLKSTELLEKIRAGNFSFINS